jgi:hypothetical protein
MFVPSMCPKWSPTPATMRGQSLPTSGKSGTLENVTIFIFVTSTLSVVDSSSKRDEQNYV